MCNKISWVVILIVINSYVVVCLNRTVALYNEVNRQGESYTMDLDYNPCFQISTWGKMVKSVDSGETCLRLYDQNSCRGRSTHRVEKGNDNDWQNDVSRIPDFGEVKSVSGCEPWVTLYDEKEQKGNEYIISLDKKNCVNNYWDKEAKSLHTHHTCVVLYDQQNCVGTSTAIHPDLENQKHGEFEGNVKSVGICTDPAILKKIALTKPSIQMPFMPTK